MSDNFDETIADNMFRMVSDMEPDEAEMFVRSFADDVYDTLVEKNQRYIVKKNAQIALEVTDQADRVCKSLISQGRDEEAIAVAIGVASGLTEIKKSGGRSAEDRKKYKRGPRGQFATSDTLGGGTTNKKVSRVQRVKPVSYEDERNSRRKEVKRVQRVEPLNNKSRQKDLLDEYRAQGASAEEIRIAREDMRGKKSADAKASSKDQVLHDIKSKKSDLKNKDNSLKIAPKHETNERLEMGYLSREDLKGNKSRDANFGNGTRTNLSQDSASTKSAPAGTAWEGLDDGKGHRTDRQFTRDVDDFYRLQNPGMKEALKDYPAFAAEKVSEGFKNAASATERGFKAEHAFLNSLQSNGDINLDWKGAGKHLESAFKPGEMPTGAEMSNMDRTWNTMQDAGRMASGIGNAATAVGIPGGSTVAIAGQAANLAGNLGPNAERIVGPSVRRAKYRNQGTERPVDKDVRIAVRQSERAVLRDVMERLPRNRQMEILTAVQQKHQPVSNFIPAEDALEATKRGALDYLRTRVPDARRNSLREGSGKFAPSEGLIIDKEGKVVTQSMGVAEDHYIPFSAKNQKKLEGGSYVRTRTIGGPTTEDIRTALTTGVKSFTVVSHSGVFEVEFDQDMRKANKGRAKQMVERYGKLLDAVQSEQVKKSPLTAMERAELDEIAEQKLRQYPWEPTAEERAAMRKKVYEEAMSRPSLSKEELIEVHREAAKDFDPRELQTEQGQLRFKKMVQQIGNRKLEDKDERFYRLNGKGYQSALKTLEDEFPYFITVKEHRVEDEALSNFGMETTDSGYVKPRFLHPEKEKHGYFGAGIDAPRALGGSKRSGDTTEYQNARYNRNVGLKATKIEEGAQVSVNGAKSDRMKQYEDKQRSAKAVDPQVINNISTILSDVNRNASASYDAAGMTGSPLRALETAASKHPDDLVTWLANPDNASALLADVDRAPGAGQSSQMIKNAMMPNYSEGMNLTRPPLHHMRFSDGQAQRIAGRSEFPVINQKFSNMPDTERLIYLNQLYRKPEENRSQIEMIELTRAMDKKNRGVQATTNRPGLNGGFDNGNLIRG